MNVIICPNCKNQMPDTAVFCDNCGTKLPAAASAPAPASAPAGGTTCPSCGAQVIPGQAFCDNCGASLVGVQPATPIPTPRPQPTPPPAPAAPVSAGTVKCPVCGAAQPAGQQFCDACGASLRAQPTPAPAPTGRFRLVLPSGAEFALAGKSEYLLGRADPISNVFPDVDLTPHGAEQAGVSRRHARLKLSGGQWLIEDLNSVNFTFVNNQKLTPGVPQPLSDGAQIRLGRLVLTFHVS